jgi:hypothetical protein
VVSIVRDEPPLLQGEFRLPLGDPPMLKINTLRPKYVQQWIQNELLWLQDKPPQLQGEPPRLQDDPSLFQGEPPLLQVNLNESLVTITNYFQLLHIDLQWLEDEPQ